MDSVNVIKRRNTKQKKIIIDYLKNNRDKHLTAEEIVDNLKSSNLKVSKATVYRLLNTLSKEGSLRKYVLAEGVCSCYQYVGDIDECSKHYHLICDNCGKVMHCDDANINKLAENISRNSEFKINMQKVVFYGKCNKCIKQKEK